MDARAAIRSVFRQRNKTTRTHGPKNCNHARRPNPPGGAFAPNDGPPPNSRTPRTTRSGRGSVVRCSAAPAPRDGRNVQRSKNHLTGTKCWDEWGAYIDRANKELRTLMRRGRPSAGRGLPQGELDDVIHFLQYQTRMSAETVTKKEEAAHRLGKQLLVTLQTIHDTIRDGCAYSTHAADLWRPFRSLGRFVATRAPRIRFSGQAADPIL